MSDDKKSTNSGANTRWWESYLVRYFSGAIVGAICLAAILLYADWRIYGGSHTKLSMDDKPLPPAVIAVLLVAGGLMYSYIISSPITVIHFGRYGRSGAEQHVRYFWLGWVSALVALQFIGLAGSHSAFTSGCSTWLIVLLIAITYLIVSSMATRPAKPAISRKKLRKENARQDTRRSLAWGSALLALVMLTTIGLGLQGRPAIVSLMAFSIPALFVGGMQYVTLFRIFRTERAVHRFYRVLTRARTLEGSKEIRETYTHLREHSNATFIVLLELCFTAFLILSIEIFAGHPSSGQSPGATGIVSEGIVHAVLMLMAIWMTPNLFMWSRANQLERDFARRPKLYAGIGRQAGAKTGDKPDHDPAKAQPAASTGLRL